jgi:ribosomal protein L12E/L44/L45/RPP1/RPP2
MRSKVNIIGVSNMNDLITKLLADIDAAWETFFATTTPNQADLDTAIATAKAAFDAASVAAAQTRKDAENAAVAAFNAGVAALPQTTFPVQPFPVS